jgi:hypothetical protein
MTLHPTVTLAEGITVPEAAWYLHGQVLTCGIANHRTTVRGFPVQEDGTLGISIHISPLDEPLPLRLRES